MPAVVEAVDQAHRAADPHRHLQRFAQIRPGFGKAARALI
jgi:hypothetical protein